VALAELLLSGTTTTSDHHYVFGHGLAQAIEIEIAEAMALGMRIVATRGSMSLGEADGGLPPMSIVEDEDRILAECERLAVRYHDPRPGAMVQVALAPCSPFSVTERLMRETAALAAGHGLRLHTHLAETEDEEAWCRARFGCRPFDYLERVGWLERPVWLAHGIWFNEDEIRRLGRARVAVSHCPTSNMILASGCCPVPALEAAGASVGLGVDGSASNDSSNLIETVRHAFLLQRLVHGAEQVSHGDALRWATQGSAACLGRSDLGRIAPGLEADLALFRLDELRYAGAGDPLAALILCGASGADRVMVAGRWVVEDGAIPGLDLRALQAAHKAAARKLLLA
jgi:8-oxoguanine deaminase